MDYPREDQIRERAYALWQGEGCPEGCADRHWQQARDELAQTSAGADGFAQCPAQMQDQPDQEPATLVAGHPRPARNRG